MPDNKGNLNRILWIADVFPRPHKMTDGVWSLKTAAAIRRHGIEVIVLSPTPWIPKCLAFTPTLRGWSNVPYTHDIENLNIFYPKCPHYPRKELRCSLYKYIPYFETEVVHRWCKDIISFLVENYPFQVTHANFMFPSGYIGYQIKKTYGVPLVFHEWGTRRLKTASETKSLRAIYSRVLRESDSVIALNAKMADIVYHQFHYHRKVNLVRAVGDVNIAQGFEMKKPDKHANHKIVLSVGSFLERKGHEYLIRAVHKVKRIIPDVYCIIIGTGKTKKKLINLITKLRLNDSIELLGEVPHNEVLKIMSWCDVFALPSWDEAFGAVYGEAMCFGKPVIGCMGEGIGEVIQDGIQGFLVKKKDVDSLTEALLRILTDEPLATKLGRNSKELASAELNYGFISSQIVDLYHSVLNRQTRFNVYRRTP